MTFLSNHIRAYDACHQHLPCVKEPFYDFFSSEEIVEMYEKEKSVFPESSVLYLMEDLHEHVYYKDSTDSYKQFVTGLEYLQTNNQSTLDLSFYQSSDVIRHKLKYTHFLSNLKKESNHKKLPVIYLSPTEQISRDDTYVKNMANQEFWLEQLITFFKVMTDQHIWIDSSISFDSFLYNHRGEIEVFTAYNLLTFENHPDRYVKITDHNLRVFAGLIQQIFNFVDPYVHNQSAQIYKHNSKVNQLFHRITDNGVEFASFENMLEYLQGKEIPRSTKKIGVFLDVANIYTGLHSMKIDFQNLFSTIFGLEQKGRIRDQHAVIFLPIYENEKKTEDVYMFQLEIKEQLEKQGFQVKEVKNGTAKAKQIINGQEYDVDDQYLIDKLKERYESLDSILLLSGDDHFYEILKKYKDAGKEVKVISIHPEDTSKRIREEFSKHHYFITDFWDCVKLY